MTRRTRTDRASIPTSKRNGLVLWQTDGEEWHPPAISERNEPRTLAALKIERIPLESLATTSAFMICSIREHESYSPKK
jgi:hypothetical protein